MRTPAAKLQLTLLFLLSAASARAQTAFVPNAGQWPQAVQYRAEVGAAALFVEGHALTWNFLEWPTRHGQQESASLRPDAESLIQHSAEPGGQPIRGHAYRIAFEGLAQPLTWRASGPLPGTYNYLIGNDPSSWASGLHAFRVLEADYAPGLRLMLYESGGNIKYDVLVAPGADPSRFALRYEGTDGLELRDGDLLIRTSLNQVLEMAPYAWQERGGQRVTVPCHYALQGSRLQFAFPEGYDASLPLVIDPVTWIFGSYSGSTADNWGYSATYDQDGNLFGAGIVFGTGYPVTLGAYQTTWGGGTSGLGCDIAITKFSADGSTNLWSTYLGGFGNEFPHSMIANSSGELWIYGTTGSTNFPVSPGAYDGAFSGGSPVTVTAVNFPVGTDLFVSRLSADGSALLASTLVGGVGNDGLNLASLVSFNYGDHARGEIVLDEAERPIVASCTNSTDFPTTAGVFQPGSSGGQEGVIFRLNQDASALEWSTYFGGSNADGVYSIKTDPDGNLVAVGGSTSPDLATTPGVVQPAAGGSADGFVLRMSADASSLLQCTYIGSPVYDQAFFTALDPEGEVYVTGQTRSASFPVTPGVYSVPSSGQFVLKLLPDFSGFFFSALYGSGAGEIDISPTAFLVDICGNIYVSGWGGVTNTFGSTTGLPVTADALKPTTDGSDFYFTVFSADMAGLEFASFFGGNLSREHVDGGTSRFDEDGVIYQAVCAGCGSNDDFPTTPGAVSNVNNSTNCNLGVAKIALEFSGVSAALDVEPALIGCLPLTAEFINNSSPAALYEWDFGDGSPVSNDFEPTHVYTTAGVFSVRLIASDPSSCNLADTAFLSVTVHEDSTRADFDLLISDFCDSLVVELDNTSFFVGTPGYFWSFGDGTSSIEESPRHVYTSPGTYTLELIVVDPFSCNGGDTLSVPVVVAPRAIAGLSGGSGCAPLELEPLNTSVGISPSYTWFWGDGNSSIGESPSYLYEVPGVYELLLIMDDPASCNDGDTATALVEVFASPELSLSADPQTGSFFQLIQFNGSSDPEAELIWDLGNGVTVFGSEPSFQYAEPGAYTVCLQAITANGCSDTACVRLELSADSELVFPNAFSPNGDGINDELLPFFWGLETYLLRIYNRWGELIFESSDPNLGWDGTFKGEPQEIGAYKLTVVGRGLDGRLYGTASDVFLVR